MNHKLALQTLTHSTTATFQLRSAHLTSPHPIKLIGTIRAAILHTSQYTTQLSPQLHLLSTTYTTRDAAIQRHLPHSPSLSLTLPHSPSLSLTLPHSPSLSLTLPHSPSLSLTLPQAPSSQAVISHPTNPIPPIDPQIPHPPRLRQSLTRSLRHTRPRYRRPLAPAHKVAALHPAHPRRPLDPSVPASK
jgi:hypothetical protein